MTENRFLWLIRILILFVNSVFHAQNAANSSSKRTTDLYTSVGDPCHSHRLRAYDAVQLACVLALRHYTLANQAPDPIFVCADVGPLEIACVVGSRPEDHNTHP